MAPDQTQFECGAPALGRYLCEIVSQDVGRPVADLFASLDSDVVVDYYALSAASIALALLRRYPAIPAVRMGRLAFDGRYRSRWLRGALQVNALRGSTRSEIPAFALKVNAKDDGAAAFCRYFVSRALTQDSLTLSLPLATVK